MHVHTCIYVPVGQSSRWDATLQGLLEGVVSQGWLWPPHQLHCPTHHRLKNHNCRGDTWELVEGWHQLTHSVYIWEPSKLMNICAVSLSGQLYSYIVAILLDLLTQTCKLSICHSTIMSHEATPVKSHSLLHLLPMCTIGVTITTLSKPCLLIL